MKYLARVYGIVTTFAAFAVFAAAFDGIVIATAAAPELAGGAEVAGRSPKTATTSHANSVIIGAVEPVRIYPPDIEVRANVDTGAKSSSVDAKILERFHRDGAEWVRYLVFGDKGVTRKLEMPIARIRRAGAPRDERSAAMMRLCPGSVAADVLVNFTERRALNYRLLLGRDFLKNRVLIDVGSNFLAWPSCKKEAPKWSSVIHTPYPRS